MYGVFGWNTKLSESTEVKGQQVDPSSEVLKLQNYSQLEETAIQQKGITDQEEVTILNICALN